MTVVPLSSLIGMLFTLLICFAVPLGSWWWLARRWKGCGVLQSLCFGALGFVIPQILLRLPLLSWLNKGNWLPELAAQQYLLYALCLSGSAALVETCGRYLALRGLQRTGLNFQRTLLAGLGHGGIEAMCLIGVTYINNLCISLMINAGTLGTKLHAAGLSDEAIQQITDLFEQTHPAWFYLAGYERLLTLMVQAALSCLLGFYLLRGKTWLGWLLCMLIHTAIDSAILLLNGLSHEAFQSQLSTEQTGWLIYLLLTGVAVAGLWLIRQTRSSLMQPA